MAFTSNYCTFRMISDTFCKFSEKVFPDDGSPLVRGEPLRGCNSSLYTRTLADSGARDTGSQHSCSHPPYDVVVESVSIA